MLRLGSLHGVVDRLSVRLMILMSAALLPLGAISINATVELARAGERASERQLIALAGDALAGERALVESALASARALESLVLERLGEADDCDALLREYADRSNLYSHIAFIDLDGATPCTSSGERMDFGDSAAFQALRTAPRTVISAEPAGRATGLPVVIVSRAVFGDGGLAGFLAVSITTRSMAALGRRMLEDAPRTAFLVNAQGVVLGHAPDSPGLGDLPAPERLQRLVAGGGSVVVRDRTREGEAAVFALSELIPRQLYALAMWEDGAPQVRTLGASSLPMLVPAAMWLASLGVVLLSIHYLVLRHLKGINRQMRRFAIGQRAPLAGLPAPAPSELRELHATFDKMSRIIARDEEEREQALHEKTVLLKELHHRVKNNLQLIASIINLQMRQLDDREARRVLRAVQERVLGLATVHRALYEEHQLDRVRADRVLEEILRRLAGLGSVSGQGPRLELALEPITLDADRVVPLSFIATEAMTNALKHTGAHRGARGVWIGVELRREAAGEGRGASVLLRVRNSLGAPAPASAAEAAAGAEEAGWDEGRGGGLGSELVEAFSLQLDGEVTSSIAQDPDRGAVWDLSLRFPAPEGAAATSSGG